MMCIRKKRVKGTVLLTPLTRSIYNVYLQLDPVTVKRITARFVNTDAGYLQLFN
jgi:hypothetical protein